MLSSTFIDEAGQMSLANVLAACQAAKTSSCSVDPQQLEQPLKGSHPEGADISALEHLLAGAKTIPADKGLLQWDDALIVSSYNAQVSDLWKRLPKAHGGTVDKFQGQQAPVVIYSMATSSPGPLKKRNKRSRGQRSPFSRNGCDDVLNDVFR